LCTFYFRFSVKSFVRPAETVEAYFRCAELVPFTDSFFLQLKDRLLDHRNVLSNFMCLLPDMADKTSFKPSAQQLTFMRKPAETYDADLQCSSDVAVAELKLWYRQLAKADKCPGSATEAFRLYNNDTLPCTQKL
jgi:hypothetical protein